MKAVVWNSASRQLVVADVPAPKPGAGEVLVAPVAVGLCGTDSDIIRGMHPVTQEAVDRGELEYLIPGHEWAGRVVALGPSVVGLGPGDRVVGEIGVPCNHCGPCRRGAKWSCQMVREVGISQNGALAEYMVIPAANLHRIPDSVSWREAALIEPLSVAVHAVLHAIVETGKRNESANVLEGALEGHSVVVWGDGPIGLLVAQVLLTTRPAFVGLVGKSHRKLALARSLGIGHTVCTEGATSPQVEKLVRELLPEPPEVVFEAAGTPEAAQECINAVMPKGRVILVGFPGLVAVDLSSVALRELVLRGSRSGNGAWDLAISLVEAGRVNLGAMVTLEFPLGEALRAYETLQHDSDNVKTVITVRAEAV